MIRNIFLRSLLTFLIAPLSIQFMIQPVMAASLSQVSFFHEVQSVDSILSLVTAATGSEKFERESRNLFKNLKVDLSKPFPALGYDGNKIRFEGLAEPVIVGATPYEFTYKGVTYLYNPKKSVKHNFEEMKKTWGQFKELSFPVATFSPFGHAAHADVGPLYVMLFSFVGVTATLAITGLAVVGYFGYKWYKDKSEPLKLECEGNKVTETKGKDRLVIVTTAAPSTATTAAAANTATPEGQLSFFSEVGGKKELSGELEKITLRGKESYAITTGNDKVNDLRTADAVELNKSLMAMKSLCSNTTELEKFNNSSRRVQEAINAGKIKILNNGPGPSIQQDPDSVSGVIR